jgi:hypothetical protein
VPKKKPDPASLDDLEIAPDAENPRSRTPGDYAAIGQSLDAVGAGRSIVIDENGRVITGKGTAQVAKGKGLRLRVVDADPDELVAVRRSGLSDEDKIKLDLWDNKTAERGGWNAEVLAALAEDPEIAGTLEEAFTAEQLAGLLDESNEGGPGGADGFGGESGGEGAGMSEPPPGMGPNAPIGGSAVPAGFVRFTFGDYGGFVSGAVYDRFVAIYNELREGDDTIDDTIGRLFPAE